MGWDIFIYFAAVAVLAGVTASALSFMGRRKAAIVCAVLGTVTLTAFIIHLWVFLGRPPLRTMGETRLWYSFFAGIAGLFTYLR